MVDLTATLSLPDRDIGPLTLALEPEGTTGSYITARTSEFDESEVSTEVPIR